MPLRIVLQPLRRKSRKHHFARAPNDGPEADPCSKQAPLAWKRPASSSTNSDTNPPANFRKGASEAAKSSSFSRRAPPSKCSGPAERWRALQRLRGAQRCSLSFTRRAPGQRCLVEGCAWAQLRLRLEQRRHLSEASGGCIPASTSCGARTGTSTASPSERSSSFGGQPWRHDGSGAVSPVVGGPRKPALARPSPHTPHPLARARREGLAPPSWPRRAQHRSRWLRFCGIYPRAPRRRAGALCGQTNLASLGRGPCARAHDHWRTASTERTAVIHVPRRHRTLALACWIPAHAPLPSHRKSGRAEDAKCLSASNSGVAPVSMPVGEGSATGTGPTSGNRMCCRQSTGSAGLRVVERATEARRLA